MNARHQTVLASDGVRLSVQSRGNPTAPTVLCVHGFPDDHSVWDGVVAELESAFHIVTFDVRGSGDSDAPNRIRDYRLDQLADDILRVADASTPGRTVHLLAHDWGSVQAWHVAAGSEGRRFASLTSISGPCLDHLPSWVRDRIAAGPDGWRDVLALWKSPLYMGLLQTPWLAPLACRLGIVDAAIGWAERFETQPRLSAPRDSARVNRAALKIYTANLLPRLLFPRPRPVDIPVHVLAPRRDVFVTAASQSHLGRWTERSRVRSIDGGHWAAAVTPTVVARELRSFIYENCAASEGELA